MGANPGGDVICADVEFVVRSAFSPLEVYLRVLRFFRCLIKLQFLNVDSIWNMYGRRKATFWIRYPNSRLKIVLKVTQG